MSGIFVSSQMHFVNAAKFIRLQFHYLFFLQMALDKLQCNVTLTLFSDSVFSEYCVHVSDFKSCNGVK